MFSERTLKSLLEDPAIAEIAPDAIKKWDLSNEEYYEWTLKKIADDMGWRNLERGFTRLFEIASRGQYYYKLYSDEECRKDPDKKGVNLVHFPSDDKEADNRPYIFLVPGGGFVNVWNLTEGWPIARIFNELGYHVFILTYRVGVEATAVCAMEDMSKAFECIRTNRENFHVDPDRYITCGFSAGGYLICLWNTEKGYSAYGIDKPKACIPVYPVTSYRLMNEQKEDWYDGDKDSFARSGVGCTMEEACNSCFEIPLHVEGFPATAIFVSDKDELVNPRHSKNLAASLEKAGIPCRLEVGPDGGHGFADGEGMCMEGWPERAIRWIEKTVIS